MLGTRKIGHLSHYKPNLFGLILQNYWFFEIFHGKTRTWEHGGKQELEP
jgi:hypothetical protein